MPVVQLGRVGPARKERILPECNHPGAAGGLRREEVGGTRRRLALLPLHIVLGMLRHPAVIPGSMIAHEIQNQTQSALRQPHPERRERFVPTERRGNGVGFHRIRRSEDVRILTSGERRRILLAQPRRRPGDLPAHSAGGPDSHQPDGIIPARGPAVQNGIRNGLQCDLLPELTRQLAEKDACIDLQEERMPGRGEARSDRRGRRGHEGMVAVCSEFTGRSYVLPPRQLYIPPGAPCASVMRARPTRSPAPLPRTSSSVPAPLQPAGRRDAQGSPPPS